MNYAAGRPCCWRELTSGFSAQAATLSDFPSFAPLLAPSTCFPLHGSQQSMSEAACLCSQAVLFQRCPGTRASQRPHRLLPARSCGEMAQEPLQANTGAFHPRPWSQVRWFTEGRSVRYCWLKLVYMGPQEHINPASLPLPSRDILFI